MFLKLKFLAAVLLISCFGFTQKINFTEVECEMAELISKHGQLIAKESYNFLYNDYDESIVKEGLKYVKRTIQEDEKKANEERELQKLQTFIRQYDSFDKYPDQIIDGWHLAVISDNSRFCKQVKVFVQSNKIQSLVVNDYLPISVQAFSKIKNAKSSVNLENLGNEELTPVDVYFLFDIEEPNLIDAPQEPGIACFWTSIPSNWEDIKLKVDGKSQLPMSVTFRKNKPNCGQLGTSFAIYKPGRYQFIALGRGTIDWQGQFDVEPGKCILIELAK